MQDDTNPGNHWSMTGLSLQGEIANELADVWVPVSLHSLTGRRSDSSWYADAEIGQPLISGHYRLRVAQDVRWVFIVPNPGNGVRALFVGSESLPPVFGGFPVAEARRLGTTGSVEDRSSTAI